MNRAHTRYASIPEALGAIPPAIRAICEPDWLIGVDPVFAGLHRLEACSDNRSYRTTAHVAYPWHTIDKTTTIVLPIDTEPHIVVHEYAHALDEALGFSHRAEPTTRYSETDREEAFAEAFVTWLSPRIPGKPQGKRWWDDWHGYYAATAHRLDEGSRDYFTRLAQ